MLARKTTRLGSHVFHLNPSIQIFAIEQLFSVSIRKEVSLLAINMREFQHSKSQFFSRKDYWKTAMDLCMHSSQQQFF